MPPSEPTPTPPLRFGDFELDPAGFELRRHGQPVRLGRQPMDVLLLLVERRGRVTSTSSSFRSTPSGIRIEPTRDSRR